MSDVVISVENLSKQYHLGTIGGKTLREDVARWWARKRGKPDPYLRIGQTDYANQEGDTIWALRDINLQVRQGEILGIIGRNGAGKSTLLKILSRITAPTSGQVKIKGRIGSLLEVGTGFHPELTGRENVYLNGAILGMTRAEVDGKFDEIVDFSGVEQYIDTPVKRYSSGMTVRLAFAVAAHLEPEILVVDEVLSVGDIEFRKKSIGKMEEVAHGGRTVLFVSHNMAAITALCSRCTYLVGGRVVADGETVSVVDEYVESSYNKTSQQADAFPISNRLYGLTMSACRIALEEHANGLSDLRIEFDVEADRPARNIGVGFSVRAANGAEVAVLGPAVTRYAIPEIDTHCTCVFHCRDLDNYLAGGDYHVGVWLSIVGAEVIVRVDNAGKFTLRARDVYGSGVAFEQSRGLVPLPVTFSVDSQQPHRDLQLVKSTQTSLALPYEEPNGGSDD